MTELQGKTLATKVFTTANIIDQPNLVMEGGVEISTDYQNLEATKECEIKQGYLGLVTNIAISHYNDESGNPVQGKFPMLTAKAMFAVLNKNSLSLFDREHVNSLYKVLDIVHLTPAYYPTAFGDLNCFQLVAIN